tara:strand:+ start:3665 stop:4675 length:1011 start_codon:yes stop_codon:yes gene_type:complete
MESLFIKIKSLRNLNDTTTKGYLSSLLRLQKKMGLSEVDINNEELDKFFQNWINILDFIKLNFKKPYQTNLLSCLIVSMEAHMHEEDEKPIIKTGLASIREYQMEIKKELDLTKYSEKKSETEEINWVPYADLQAVIKTTNKRVNKILKIGRPITLKEAKDIMLWVVANLYVGSKENPPLRLDYNNMIVLSEKDYLENNMSEGQNYLVIISSRTKYFVLGEYKTFKKYGKKSIKLSPVLNKVINRWEQIKGNMIDNVKIHNNYLLFNNKAEPLSESLMSTYIADAFKSTGKHITVNLLRHIFITDVVSGLPLIERKKISDKMCHNIEMQQIYNKAD